MIKSSVWIGPSCISSLVVNSNDEFEITHSGCSGIETFKIEITFQDDKTLVSNDITFENPCHSSKFTTPVDFTTSPLVIPRLIPVTRKFMGDFRDQLNPEARCVSSTCKLLK
jgi:hypothetical protein